MLSEHSRQTGARVAKRETRSPESPDQKDEYDQPQRPKRPILLQQQLPIDPHRCALVLGRVLSKPTTHIPHLLQAVSAVQQVLDVLCHDLRDILELVVQARQVVSRAGVLVCLLCPLDIAVELAVRVGSQRGIEVVFALVGCLELGADVFEVGEGELFGVRLFGDGDICEVIVEDVAVGAAWSVKCRRSLPPLAGCGGVVDALHGVLTALDGRSRLGGGCQFLDDLADLSLELLHFLHILVVY